MRLRLFMLVMLLPAALITAGQGVVMGVVKDAETLVALPGVNIIYGEALGSVTANNGTFILKLKPGSYRLEFSFVGYMEQAKNVVVQPSDTISIDMFLQSSVTSIDEIVVSAGKKEQRVSELTVSMDVIKPYTITGNHILNAEELLNRTTGIEIMDGQASIRGGSGYSYGAGSRVLALINGLPILSTDAGNIKWQTLPVENIEQVEVIKGASSVLYGSSALNGVINFITAKPGPEPVTRVSLTTGMYDSPSNHSWKWWDSPRMVQSASFSHTEMSGNTAISAGGRLLNDNGYRRLNDEHTGRLNFGVDHTSSRNGALSYGAALYSTMTAKTDFLLWEDALTGALKQQTSTAMPFRGTSIAVDPYLKYVGSKGVTHEIRARALANINKLPENSNNNSDSYSLFSEYQITLSRGKRLSIVSGLSQQYSRINSNFYGDHSGYNIALYSQAEYRPLEHLKLAGGMRLEENFLDGNADRLVPIFRAGINWQAGSNTFIRGSFGQGYRYPAVAEKFAYTTVGSIMIFPNNEIRPESGWSAEAGVRQLFSTERINGNFDLALFYTQNSDLIEYVFGLYIDPFTDSTSIGFKPVNIENSRVYGAETSISINRSFGSVYADLSAGYTFMYPVEFNSVTGKNSGEWLKYRRKHSAELTLRLRRGGAELSCTGFYKSAVLDIDPVFTGPLSESLLPGFADYWPNHNHGWFMLDLMAGYRLSQAFRLSFMIKNVTNTEYMGRPGDVMPHRFYSLQADFRF